MKIGRDGTDIGEPDSSDEGRKKIVGWVVVTNQNIDSKHDERVFFHEGNNGAKRIALTEAESKRISEQWRELIEEYQELHRAEIRQRLKDPGGFVDDASAAAAYLGKQPGKTSFSRHVYEPAASVLSNGTLCYAKLSTDGTRVESLQPVCVSRHLHEKSPAELLPAKFAPAQRWSEFSTADRVFGWVPEQRGRDRQKRHDAGATDRPYKGHIRIGPVDCNRSSTDAIERFPEPGVPLQILGAPKPHQGRFYVGRTDGSAQDDGRDKPESGYVERAMLRGRKVYPHHKGWPQDYWSDPMKDRTQDGSARWHQEYRRPDFNDRKQFDSQNSSVRTWVKPETIFSTTIRFDNLSRVELGALLYLFRLPEGHFLRMGGGKPLGFGSVRASLTNAAIMGGTKILERYQDLLPSGDTPTANLDEARIQALISDFEKALEVTFGSRNPPHLRAFLQASRGFDDELPVHYPRRCPIPDPSGKNFEWFVENDRGKGLALPDLERDPGLPRT